MEELNIEENELRNKKFIKEFNCWLKKQNLAAKTIRKHTSLKKYVWIQSRNFVRRFAAQRSLFRAI